MNEENSCIYLHEVSSYEEDFAKKIIDGNLRFLAKVYKTTDSKGQVSRRPRVRLLALGKHRLYTIRTTLNVSVVKRSAHIHDLFKISLINNETLRIEFKNGQEAALTITIPWETPMTASLVRMLLTAWYETGGSLLTAQSQEENHVIPPIILDLGETFNEETIINMSKACEEKQYLDLALYTRLRSYVWRDVKTNTIAALEAAQESTELDLNQCADEKNRLTKLDIYAIAGVLAHSTKYKSLKLEKKRLEENACSDLLLPAISASKSLHIVILRDVGLQHFPSKLFLSWNLRVLDLSGNNIGERGAQCLAQAICTTSLQHLALRSCRLIAAAGILELLTNLAIDCKHLTWLDLGQNFLGATGLAGVAWLVRTSSTLLHLDVNDNKAPLTTLASAIANHKSLQYINVSTNFFLEEDSLLTAQSLARCPAPTVRLAAIKYQSSIMQSQISALDLAMAIPPKRLNLLDVSGNQLPTEGLSFDTDTLIADETPGAALPSLLQNAHLRRLSFRKCTPVSSVAQTMFSTSSIVENTTWTDSLHDFSPKLTVLNLAQSRLGANLVAQLIRALPPSLQVLDLTGCGSGDAGLDALCTFLRSPSGALERLACDGQRPRVSIVGIRNLVDGIRVCESLIDLKAPIQDAMRAARAEPQFAAEIAKLIKRARQQVLENNIKHKTNAIDAWTNLCDADDKLPHDTLPAATPDETWDVLQFLHFDITANILPTDHNIIKKPAPPPKRPQADEIKKADETPPSRPAPPAPLEPPWGNNDTNSKNISTPTRSPPPPPPPRRPGFLDAIQGRSVASLRATPNKNSSPSSNTTQSNGTSSALNSAIDQVLGRRQHIQHHSTDDEDDDDDDDDW
uniref:Uncharacterized protein n=1 Tax=Aureoumbra lagunensis TaxID=44058 RepID=A0A7S3NP21_9STRA